MKNKKNFLDYIPVCNPKITWELDESGFILLHKENTGIIYKVTQLLFHKPRFSHITLESYGSYIWTLIDGKRTVFDIACLLNAKFGGDAEPLYERISQYFKELFGLGLIELSPGDQASFPAPDLSSR